MDPAAMLADRPWRPLSLHPVAPALRMQPANLLLLLGIMLLHFMAARWLWTQMGGAEATREVITVLEFPPTHPVVQQPPSIQAMPVPAQSESHAATAPNPPLRKRVLRHARVAPAVAADQARVPGHTQPDAAASTLTAGDDKSPASLQIYNDNGRLRVPADMLDQIDRRYGDKRVFSYQIPHMDDAKKYFDRNQVLSFETTRFEEFYKPDRDMLTELLQKLVEKSTRQLRIPVPGKPGSTMVCTVSLLALGGGCGVQRNGSEYVGAVDDPDTLSAEENRQCQAWWQQLIDARTQDAWRQTRQLYERQCRKPLARDL